MFSDKPRTFLQFTKPANTTLELLGRSKKHVDLIKHPQDKISKKIAPKKPLNVTDRNFIQSHTQRLHLKLNYNKRSTINPSNILNLLLERPDSKQSKRGLSNENKKNEASAPISLKSGFKFGPQRNKENYSSIPDMIQNKSQLSPTEVQNSASRQLRNLIDLKSQFSICSPEKIKFTTRDFYSPSDIIRQTVTSTTIYSMIKEKRNGKKLYMQSILDKPSVYSPKSSITQNHSQSGYLKNLFQSQIQFG